jgi:hypothetical protein
MKKIHYLLPLLIVVLSVISGCNNPSGSKGWEASFSFSDSLCSDTLQGRLLLFVSTVPKPEPRFTTRDGYRSQQVFGTDVEGWIAGEQRTIGMKDRGYPIISLKDLPAGDYFIQGLFHRYETFQLSTGHTVSLPMDRGEGQNLRVAPGNLYSKPQKITLDPSRNQTIRLVLDQKIPPIQPPEDTKYIKHIRIQSKLLTEFWGRPMFIGAHILLPEGFDEHREARYPLCVFHGHFPSDLSGFRTEPPDTSLTGDYSERFSISGYARIQQEEAYRFYQHWVSKDFPRFLVVEIQHANPYYDDSYAVNSANLGPYGDAINKELIPEIEKQFHGIGEGWARFTYGGSTGGWEALATQVFYPDMYNGCFAACPDPIDFRAYSTVNIYKDRNAYFYEGPFTRLVRPGFRNYLGQLSASVQDMNYHELVLGTHGRSGGQWDIWQAVFSPQRADGYPVPIWDKETGIIDSTVAAYWYEHYDLRHILQRDWKTLGPKLKGKIHIYCGDMDNYYLNDAVYLMEEFLEATTDPYYTGQVDYGDRAEHCWNGDHANPNYISRLRYNEMYIPKILEQIRKTAPPGADLKSWRY